MEASDSVNGSEEENEEHITRNGRRKAYPCYIVAENLAELCPIVVWKAEFVTDEIEEMPKQSIEGVALCLLALCSQI